MAAAPTPAPATLRIVSRSTIVTGAPNAPVHNPPGTPVELAAEEAADLIARGIATRANVPPPEPATGPSVTTEAPASGGATVTQAS
jgi:hypothetical protein